MTTGVAEQVDVRTVAGELVKLWGDYGRGACKLTPQEAGLLARWQSGDVKLVGKALDKAIQTLQQHGRWPDEPSTPAGGPEQVYGPLCERCNWPVEPADGDVATQTPVAAATGIPPRRYLQPSRGRIIEVWEALGGEWIAGWRTNGRGGGHRFKGVATARTRDTVQVALDEYARLNRWPEVDADGQPMGERGGVSPPVIGDRRKPGAEDTGGLTPPRSPSLVGAQIVEIPVDKIHRRPSNRGGQAVKFPDVADLMESIEQFGLSQPIQVRPVSEEQELPVGHYELVKGERRWTAYRALGRDTIPAIVLTDLDARQATIQAGIDNTHGAPLDPIQRLREIQAAVDRGGCTLAEAAISRGIKPKQAEGDLRILRLPEELVKAIAEGRLAVSVARVMLPYREIPAVMKRFCRAMRDKEPWLRRDRDGDQELRHQIQRLVQEVTRPLDGTRYYAGYQVGEVKCEFANAMTEDRKAAVKAVEVRAGNKPVLLATDVKAWERVNAEAKAERQQAEAKIREKQAKKARAEGKSANPQAERQQDESLTAKVAAWRSQFLRLAIASHLVPGDYRTRKVAAWVRAAARSDYGNTLVEDDWLCAVLELRGVPTAKLEDWRSGWWDRIQLGIRDAGDPTADDEEILCALTKCILWPVSPAAIAEDSIASSVLVDPYSLPQRLPELDADEIQAVSEYLAGPPIVVSYKPWPTRLADGWQRARSRGPEFAMLSALIEMPNRRQLAGWVKDWKLDVDVSRKLDDVRQEILQVHAAPHGKGLPIPAWLQPAKKQKGRK